MTDTNNQNSVMLDRNARILREALTKCRRDVSIPLRDKHVRDLIKRVENDRAVPHEHIVTIMWDAFSRNAPRELVEGPGHALLAMVGAWYNDAATSLDVPTLIRLETEAKAIGSMAEIDAALCPSRKTYADAAERLRHHILVEEQLVGAFEQSQFAADDRYSMVA